MRIKLLIVTILVVFSAGIISSVIVIKNKPIPEVDLIAINDVVKTVEKNWGQINEETFHNSNIKQSIFYYRSFGKRNLSNTRQSFYRFIRSYKK